LLFINSHVAPKRCVLQCPPQPTFCSPRWPTSIKLNADLLRRTLPPKQGRTQNGGTPTLTFFSSPNEPLSEFLWKFIRAVDQKYMVLSNPFISLNTMQIPARIENTDFPKNCRFSMFGASPISPTQDVKVNFNSARALPQKRLSPIFQICFGSYTISTNCFLAGGPPLFGYAPDKVKLTACTNYSPSTTIERKITKINV